MYRFVSGIIHFFNKKYSDAKKDIISGLSIVRTFSKINLESNEYSELEYRMLLTLSKILHNLDETDYMNKILKILYRKLKPKDRMYSQVTYNLALSFHEQKNYICAINFFHKSLNSIRKEHYKFLHKIYYGMSLTKNKLNNSTWMDDLQLAIHYANKYNDEKICRFYHSKIIQFCNY